MANDAGSDGDSSPGVDIFIEPEGYYQPEKPPTLVPHQLQDGRLLNLRLVGQSPLWGHLLWNAGRTVADYLETNAKDVVRHKSVLELGAGAGLPSLVCALFDASQVVVTDYPDQNLIDNLKDNIQLAKEQIPSIGPIAAEGYLWGAPEEPLLRHLKNGDDKFDLLILADLLFNHSEHQKLLNTVTSCLSTSPSAQALVFFTPYRPWLLENDLNFFNLARDQGFKVTKILEKVMDKVMFEHDPGDELLRRTVFGYKLQFEAAASA